MREIKFKAWNLDKKEWVTDWDSGEYSTIEFTDGKNPVAHMKDLVDEIVNGEHEQYERFETISNIVASQYTGLKDKNDKEIYEGDIINDQFNCGQYCVISWLDDEARFGYSYPLWNRLSNESGCHHALDKESSACKGEVIGNIYENPELLEAQS